MQFLTFVNLCRTYYTLQSNSNCSSATSGFLKVTIIDDFMFQ